MQPLISAICPTFGRAPHFKHLLEECLYWFTRQTWENRELLIFNDCPVQRLACNVPGVRVVNTKTKYPTLGDKYNAMLDEARGEIICPWEDDDISLPHRMSQAFEKIKNASYFNPQRTWFENSGELTYKHTHGVCHNASAYWKDFANSFGGYSSVTGSQDAKFDHRAKHKIDTIKQGGGYPNNTPALAAPLEAKEEWSYIYRWGVSNIHLSGVRDMQALYMVAHATPCVITLTPRMGKDYELETKRICGTAHTDCGTARE